MSNNNYGGHHQKSYNQNQYGDRNGSGGRGRDGGMNNFPNGKNNYFRDQGKKKLKRAGWDNAMVPPGS